MASKPTRTRVVSSSRRDAFLDRVEIRLLSSGVLARQAGPGLYVLSNGSSFRVELPEVQGRRDRAGKGSVSRVATSTPLSRSGGWLFHGPNGGAWKAFHQTWHGARAAAAVELRCEPGALTLWKSPL